MEKKIKQGTFRKGLRKKRGILKLGRLMPPFPNSLDWYGLQRGNFHVCLPLQQLCFSTTTGGLLAWPPLHETPVVV